MDPALQELYAEGGADDEVAVILRLAEDGPPPEGARIVARFGQIATCRLRRGDIPLVRAVDAVRSMKAAHLYGPTPVEAEDHEGDDVEMFDDEPATPHASDTRRPAGDLPTGRGIVIAHIDWGIDFAHPDFRDAQGRTRLLALWDQGKGMDPARPNRYGYGRIHTAADIDRALAAPKPYDALDYHPADSDTGPGSHGTHTLGISAGNGRAGGPLGVAPEADLVFVHLSTYTADGPARLGDSVALLEAFDFIATVADGRPVVINASIGKQAGEHDGKTVVEQGMDAFLLGVPGRAIVLSTGNYFKRDSHAQGLLRPGETRTLHLVADSERRTPTEVDLWYPGVDRFVITVRGPDGKTEVKVAPGEKAEIIVDGREIGRLYHRIGDPNNGDNQATLYLYKVAPPARWELTLYGDDVADGRYHAWVERDGICATCQAHFLAADAEPTGTTGTICNGLRTIAVGAYDARRQERPLAPFSSCGPTRDGRQKPDLAAPGVKVLAARSTPREPLPDTPLLTRMSGTSMAAPHVTGTVALMFQAAGHPLHIEVTRRLLLGNSEAAAPDADTQDHLRLGSGYLDTSAVIAAARQAAPRTLHTQSISLNPDNRNGRKAVMNETAENPAAEASRRENSHADQPAPLPFQVQLPIGGGSPALALPIGGAASPIAFSVPLGGSPAPAMQAAPIAPAAAAPVTSSAPAAQPGDEPVKTASSDFPLYVPPTEIEWAESGPPGERPLIHRGSHGSAVLEAQQKLNAVHQRRQAAGMPGLDAAPLVENGLFDEPTYQAVIAFQGIAFPDQPREWDGIVGPKTWAMLDQMSADSSAPPDQLSQAGQIAPAPQSPEAAWFAAWKEAVAHPERYTPMPEYQGQERAAESAESVPFAESAASQSYECRCGERLLAAADAYAQSEALRPASAEALIEALLNAEEERETADEAEGGDIAVLAPPRTSPYTPTALFNAFAYADNPLHPRAAQQRHYARRLQCIAAPGDHLTDLASAPRPGDLLIRVARGEGWGSVSVVAAAGLHPLERLAGRGLRAEGGSRPQPGAYLHVVEVLPKAQASYAGFARRLTDGASMVLGDTLLLRPRGASMPRVSAEAEESCGCATEAAAEAETGYIPEGGAPALPAALASPCITLDRFARDSDKLLAEHRKQIADAARDILAAGSISVIVTGYASTDGANDYNFALGMRRATTVVKALHDALETAKPGSSKGIALIPRSRGEEEQIAGGTLTLNRRVTICPAVPQPKPQPQPIQQRYFFLFAKSFIGHIGSNTGSLNCGIGPFTSPTTNPALHALAAATDAAFSEDPKRPYMFVAPPPDNKGYRLFSSVRVQVEYRGQEILSVTPFGGILTDAGKECGPGGICMQAPPLIEDIPFSVNRLSPSRVQFKWGVKGRPPSIVEPVFDAICRRSCVYIWHHVKGTVDCSSGVPVFTSLVIEGSRFPSHRLWLDDKPVFNVPQGPFSGLWDEEPGDPSRVH